MVVVAVTAFVALDVSLRCMRCVDSDHAPAVVPILPDGSSSLLPQKILCCPCGLVVLESGSWGGR